MDNDNTITTTDLALAAFLRLSNFAIIELDNTDTRRCVFHFENKNEIKQAIYNYWGGTARVEPQSYAQSIKFVKNSIYDTTRKGN